MSGLILPKEPMAAIRGHGAVELFDDRTGKLYRRESFENFITSETKNYMKWMARKTFWSAIYGTINNASGAQAGTGSDPNHPFDWVEYTNNPTRFFDHQPNFNLKHIACWDDTTAEDTTEDYAFGSVVAWANKQVYAGTDTKRGTPNLTEAFTDPTKVKWVFDWANTAGNGTFQSIGWLWMDEARLWQRANWWSAVSAPAFGSPGTPYTGNGYGSQDWYENHFDSDDANNRVIALISDSGSPFHFRLWAASWDLQTWTQIADNALQGQVAVAGTKAYNSTFDTNANPCLRKYDLATGTIDATVANKWSTLLGVTTSDRITDIAYDGTNLLLVIGQPAGRPTVFKVNPSTGALVSSFSTAPYIATAAKVAVGPSGDIWVADYDFRIARFSPSGTFKAAFSGIEGDLPSVPHCMAWRNSGGVTDMYMTQYNGPMYLKQVNKRGMGARTLLGSPLTKASTQTMKITYEFDFS